MHQSSILTSGSVECQIKARFQKFPSQLMRASSAAALLPFLRKCHGKHPNEQRVSCAFSFLALSPDNNNNLAFIVLSILLWSILHHIIGLPSDNPSSRHSTTSTPRHSFRSKAISRHSFYATPGFARDPAHSFTTHSL